VTGAVAVVVACLRAEHKIREPRQAGLAPFAGSDRPFAFVISALTPSRNAAACDRKHYGEDPIRRNSTHCDRVEFAIMTGGGPWPTILK